jgi:formylglycine-generating enzyme required for sulfatase activity
MKFSKPYRRLVFFLIGTAAAVLVLIIAIQAILKNRAAAAQAEQIRVAVQTMQVIAVQTAVSQMHAELTAKAPTPTLPPLPTPEPGAGAVRVNPVDRSEMAYIPAGQFIMGASDSDTAATGRPEEKPQRKVFLDGFWIDKLLVTNAQYDACFQFKGCKDRVHDANKVFPHYGDPEYANHPAIYVNWFDAVAYCKWAGGRLPNEAEWEKAARGTDGRLYPWGNEPPNALLANYENGAGYTTEVTAHPQGASPYGLLDMAGNVRQWVQDWYSDNYYSQSPNSNPPGPESGEERVLRGASWGDPADYLRTTSRLKHLPSSPGDPRGFRCASSN